MRKALGIFLVSLSLGLLLSTVSFGQGTLSSQVLRLLGRVNTWTATQTFDAIVLNGSCSGAGCASTGGGTVSNSGTLTSGALMVGAGTTIVTAGDLSGAVTTSGSAVTALSQTYLPFDVVQGRLTTETAVPVSTSDRIAQSTVYFTPYKGSKIGLYTGSLWEVCSFTEFSLALTGLTTDKNYDLFATDSGSCTIVLSTGTAWTDGTTRAAALALQNGIYVLGSDHTKRWLGTLRTTSTTTTEDSAKKRFVWNAANQIQRNLQCPAETTDTWAYSTATWRQARASTTNQFEVISGDASTVVDVRVVASAIGSADNVTGSIGIGLDSTSTLATNALAGRGCGSTQCTMVSTLSGPSGLGYHTYAWLEIGNGTATMTWNGDAGVVGVVNSGLTGTLWN